MDAARVLHERYHEAVLAESLAAWCQNTAAPTSRTPPPTAT